MTQCKIYTGPSFYHYTNPYTLAHLISDLVPGFFLRETEAAMATQPSDPMIIDSVDDDVDDSLALGDIARNWLRDTK